MEEKTGREKKSLRVCSYNIHKGMCAVNKSPILASLREVIRQDNADLVCLQEVAGESPRAHFDYPQFEFLADDVWPHFAYGRNAIYQRGHHGNAILSKHPFVEWHNTDISHWWFSQRGVLLGRLTTGVYVACVHLGLLALERNRQLKQLFAVIAEHVPKHAPLLIAGDFNDWTGAIHRKIIAAGQFKDAYSECHGRLAKTFPARRPLLSMDRIYFRHMQVTEAKILGGQQHNKLSDHRALFASFEFDG